jgi:hypothetical protein
MPHNTRRKKARFADQSKKKAARQSRQAEAIRKQEVIRAREPVASAAATPAAAPEAPAKTAAARYPFITAELWTIGILAVLMLIILFILSNTLS